MDEKLKFDTQLGEARLGFCFHIALFLAGNSFLIVVNLHYYTDSMWALWLTGIWFLVLIVHGIKTRRVLRKGETISPFSKPNLIHKGWGKA